MKKFIVDEDFHPDVEWYPELIHCCDCINCVKEPNGELYCDILAIGYEPLGSKKVTEDWFCADGERKKDGSGNE